MVLQEVFDQLACSELNNISVVNQETKQIELDAYSKVATAINAGLTQLHTRFLLRTGVLRVVLHEDQANYELKTSRMIPTNGVATADRYIKAANDFRDNLLKINAIYDDRDLELPINKQTRGYNIIESSYDTITVVPGHGECRHISELRIEYRQNHKMIPAYCEGLDPECYGLTLPRSHLWALCLFVAARMHIPVGLQDATYSGNSFMALFTAECDRLEFGGFQLQTSAANEGIVRKRFP